MAQSYAAIDVLKSLKQRYPFLLVDRVEKAVIMGPPGSSRLGNSIRAVKNVSFNEPFFQGHFPGHPVMPGVLILEAMAQAGSLVLNEPGYPPDLLMVRISNAKFRSPVVPGMQLVLECHVLKERGKSVVIACKATVEGKIVAEAEIMAQIFDEGFPEGFFSQEK